MEGELQIKKDSKAYLKKKKCKTKLWRSGMYTWMIKETQGSVGQVVTFGRRDCDSDGCTRRDFWRGWQSS